MPFRVAGNVLLLVGLVFANACNGLEVKTKQEQGKIRRSAAMAHNEKGLIRPSADYPKLRLGSESSSGSASPLPVWVPGSLHEKIPGTHGVAFNQGYQLGSKASIFSLGGKMKRSPQFHQNFQPGSVSNSFDCGFGGCHVPQAGNYFGGHHLNVGHHFNQDYNGGSRAVNIGKRWKRSAQFYQDFNAGSRSNSFSIASGRPAPHGQLSTNGTVFNQGYGFGSHATNVDFRGRKKRSPQFHQNFQPGSVSNSFNCGFGGCHVPQAGNHFGGHHLNVGQHFNQDYNGGSGAVNIGKRWKRSAQFYQNFNAGSRSNSFSIAGGHRGARFPSYFPGSPYRHVGAYDSGFNRGYGGHNAHIGLVWRRLKRERSSAGNALLQQPLVVKHARRKRSPQFYQTFAPGAQNNLFSCTVLGNCSPVASPKPFSDSPTPSPFPAYPSTPLSFSEPVSVHGTPCYCSNPYPTTTPANGVNQCHIDATRQTICRCICQQFLSSQYRGPYQFYYGPMPYFYPHAQPAAVSPSASRPIDEAEEEGLVPREDDAKSSREKRQLVQTYNPGTKAVNINCGPNGCLGVGSLLGTVGIQLGASTHRHSHGHGHPHFGHSQVNGHSLFHGGRHQGYAGGHGYQVSGPPHYVGDVKF